MARKRKDKRLDINKAGAKDRRKNVDNINQKAAVFKDKRTKRNRTRQTEKDKAIDESKE